MQYIFMLGKRTADAAFTLRKHAEEFGSNKKKLFFVPWSWKSFWWCTERNYLSYFETKECLRIFGKWDYDTISDLQNYYFSQRGIIRLFFCESWCSSTGYFKAFVICHCNTCFEQRCAGSDEVIQSNLCITTTWGRKFLWSL